MEVERNEDLIKEKEEEAQALVEIWRYVLGFSEMAAVKCAIELGIADLLEDRQAPIPLSNLSSSLGCCSSALLRVMRFLSRRGIFKEERLDSTAGEPSSAVGYVHTPISRLLKKGGERSMAEFVLLETNPVMLAPWLRLSAQVLKGGRTPPPFESIHGRDIWRYAEANPAHSELINDAMACGARVATSAVVRECPEVFNGVGCLVDVGGGNGTALRILIEAFPWIRGINFDLPHVVNNAKQSHGVRHVGGDMFQSIPNADAAFIMWVLHDWGDEECIQILKKCREAIPKEKGKVIIVEAVIEEEKGGDNKLKDVGLMLDMVMMAHTKAGKERTLNEWSHVLTAAGYGHPTVKHIQAVQSVIVASSI